MQHGKYRFIVGFLAAAHWCIYAVFVISPFVQASISRSRTGRG